MVSTARGWRTRVGVAVYGATFAATSFMLAACDSGGSATSATSAASPTSLSSSSPWATSSTPSTSTSAPAAYGPVKPDFPAEAKKQTLKGAQEFVQYFYDVANYALTRPEAGLLTKLGTAECKPCTLLERQAVGLVEKKSRFKGPVVKISHVENVTTSLGNPLVLVSGVQNSVPVVDSAGEETAGSPRGDINFRVELGWTSEGWRVRDVVNT